MDFSFYNLPANIIKINLQMPFTGIDYSASEAYGGMTVYETNTQMSLIGSNSAGVPVFKPSLGLPEPYNTDGWVEGHIYTHVYPFEITSEVEGGEFTTTLEIPIHYIYQECPDVVDMNGDGLVDCVDLGLFYQYWFGDAQELPSVEDCVTDVNGDGASNIHDYFELASLLLDMGCDPYLYP